jgi:hypothetical protein
MYCSNSLLQYIDLEHPCFFSPATPAKILCFSKMLNITKCVCVCVCFLSSLCCDARHGVTEKIKALQARLLGFLVSSYESERISSDFYRNCGRNLIPALGQKCQPQIFKPPSLWARRTRTSLMRRSDPAGRDKRDWWKHFKSCQDQCC